MTPQEPRSPRVSIRSVIEARVASDPQGDFLFSVQSGTRVRNAELAERVDRWRVALSDRLVAEGSRAALLISDPIEFSVCFVALLDAGLWVAPLDPTFATGDARHLNGRLANLRLDLVISDRPAPVGADVTWFELSAPTFSQGSGSHRVAASSGGGVNLASSGTTGTPKVVALSMDQLLHTAALIAEHNGLDEGERGLNPLPLWHVNAEVVGLLATLVGGASIVLDDRFHRTDFWSVVERFQVTWINAVPAIIARLTVLREGETVPEGVRFIRSASAPLSTALLAHFEESIGIPVVESYGMTEASSQICANPLDGERKVGSVGRAVGVELRVVPIDDPWPAFGAASERVGNIEIRGPSVIRDYDAPGYEDRFDSEGWLRTGDLGYLDEDEYLFIVGRSDDVINRGGEKIFPREIEELVLAIDVVLDAAVIAVADDVFGQVPVLYVQFDAVNDSTPADVIAGLTSHVNVVLAAALARARRPVEINVVTQMPTHATGKVQRHSLGTEAVAIIFQEVLR
jgi:acyl-CoA synthetase (AMP-forming)/AMP-acid ligase II